MRIALDAMGGDFAPGPIIAGALQAVQSDTELSVVLVGDKDQIDPHIQGHPNSDRIKVFHCTQAIGMRNLPLMACVKNLTTPFLDAGSCSAKKKLKV